MAQSQDALVSASSGDCLSQSWFDFECQHKYEHWRRILARNHHVHIIASLTYVIIVFFGQSMLKNRRPLSLKPLLFLWNTSLAVFSILGAIRMYQDFKRYHSMGGFYKSLCFTIEDEIPGIWTFAFCLSKIAEFGDTILLVLRKRPVIFLHWYHHVTVLMFTWVACSEASSVGRTFMLMNFVVHSIMYTYYALQSIGIRSPKLISISITTLQILQMLGGISAILYARKQLQDKRECFPGKLTVPFGLVIYGSYLVLFCNFFIQTYLMGKSKRNTTKNALAGSSHDFTDDPKKLAATANGSFNEHKKQL